MKLECSLTYTYKWARVTTKLLFFSSLAYNCFINTPGEWDTVRCGSTTVTANLILDGKLLISFAPSVNGEKEPCLAPLWKADYTLVCSLEWWMTPLRLTQNLKRAVQSHSRIASSIGVGCQQWEVWLDWKLCLQSSRQLYINRKICTMQCLMPLKQHTCPPSPVHWWHTQTHIWWMPAAVHTRLLRIFFFFFRPILATCVIDGV